MRVISYEAHNVMRVSDIKFDLQGKHLFLVGGKNAQGKTSALTALLAALCGKSGMDYPGVLLKDGEDEGLVRVELTGDEELHEPDGLTVELQLKRKRGGAVVEQFRILDSSGEEAPEPRTLLKKLYELRAFDPLDFAQRDRKERKAILEKLLSLDFTSDNVQWKRLYDQRTEVNREVAKLEANLKTVNFWKEAPAEEVSVSSLMKELEAAQLANVAVREDEKKVACLLSEAEQKIDAAIKAEEQAKEMLARADRLKKEAKEATAKAHAIEPKATIDEAPIRQQIKDADSINQKVRENLRRKALSVDLKDAETRSEELSDKMQAIKDGQEKKMREAKFPVEGMSLDEEGVLLNGLPFEQASGREQLMASVEVGMALNPRLRLMVCQDASRLDEDAIVALDEKLKENDFQMIAEIVTRSEEDDGRCAVVISNGKVKK